MKLYFAPGTCSLSPHIALREAGLEFQLVRVDIRRGQLVDGQDFLAINPKGYVPVLELDDGTRLSEGPAIVQYIADRRPEKGLAPSAGSMDRYRLQEWLAFLNSEVHKGFSPLFKPDTPAAYKEVARDKLCERLAYVAEHLATSNYLLGDHFTVADGYLFTVLGWCRWVAIDLAQWPPLLAFQQRIGDRPSVREAIAAEAA